MRPGSDKLAQVNGIQLGYEEFGQGDPLILLHGGFGTMEMFGPNVEALADHRRVIGLDLQSHGRLPAADRPMRFQTMADDIAELITMLDLGRAAIMGFSLGGGVALRTGIQHPDMVERLVLVSTPFQHSGLLKIHRLRRHGCPESCLPFPYSIDGSGRMRPMHSTYREQGLRNIRQPSCGVRSAGALCARLHTPHASCRWLRLAELLLFAPRHAAMT